MIKNRHQNLFYYYRGPSNRKQLNENQLEDNATKSLINVLEFSNKLNDKNISNCFLSMIGLEESPVVSFGLQCNGSESRPDGLIRLNAKSIVIETKIDALWDKSQINNHLKDLRTDDLLLLIGKNKPEEDFLKDNRVKFISWREVYSSFKILKLKSEMQEFLNQFLEYLEIIGVSDFCGFDENDFEIVGKLKKKDVEDEEKQILKAKMGLLANKIIEENKKDEGLHHYVKFGLGNMQKHDDSRVWLAIKRDDFPIKLKESYLSQCNFTIEINEKELRINAVIRNGRINRKRTPVYYFFSKLDKYLPLFDTYRDLSLLVYKRVSMREGQKVGRGNEKWIDPKTFKFSELKTEDGF